MPLAWPALDRLRLSPSSGLVLGFAVSLAFCVIFHRRRLQSCEQTDTHMSRISGLFVSVLPFMPVPSRTQAQEPTSKDALVEEVEDIQQPSVRQPYDAFLVLDVEGTARKLEVVDEFRSFAKPTWRPQLSQFCTMLTGITQAQVDDAPTFPEVLHKFREFLEDNGLIEPETGRRLTRFCFCSDGPYDIRDFVIKQCFISKIPVPVWLRYDVMDVRRVVGEWHFQHTSKQRDYKSASKANHAFPIPKRISFSIPGQLQAMDLAPFEGRQHSGIDVKPHLLVPIRGTDHACDPAGHAQHLQACDRACQERLETRAEHSD
ncbi:3'-5' exonuclease eri-1 [Grifola frondosa]|uniref:3'-5' exonuclease eri-1 n=1 Tax=Grifola frondosa TaxID=5627 RepID=A0A1C7MF20_GRIFR|nr:3'-5' exonuclease eri-1 [Grifola frondosa]